MKKTELEWLESQLDSIASRIYHNRDKIDNIREQIRVLNEQIKAYSLVMHLDCDEFTYTMDKIEKQFTLSEYARIKIEYKGFPLGDSQHMAQQMPKEYKGKSTLNIEERGE